MIARRLACALLAAALARTARAAEPPPGAIDPPTSGYGHLDRSGVAEGATRAFLEGYLVTYFGTLSLSSSFDNEQRRSARLLGVVGGLGGSAISLAVGYDRPVGTADVVLVNLAQDWGLGHGLLVPFLLQIGGCPNTREIEQSQCLRVRDLRIDFAAGAAASLGAGLAAHIWGPRLHMSPGQASAVASAGLWSGAIAWLVGLAVKDEDAVDGTMRARLGASLLAADLGLAAALTFRRRLAVDRSDVLLLDLLGAGGAGLGWVAAQEQGDRTRAGVAAGGAVVGLGLGALFAHGLGGRESPARQAGPAIASYRDGSWGLGVPSLQILPSLAAPGSVVAGLGLAEGTF